MPKLNFSWACQTTAGPCDTETSLLDKIFTPNQAAGCVPVSPLLHPSTTSLIFHILLDNLAGRSLYETFFCTAAPRTQFKCTSRRDTTLALLWWLPGQELLQQKGNKLSYHARALKEYLMFILRTVLLN